MERSGRGPERKQLEPSLGAAADSVRLGWQVYKTGAETKVSAPLVVPGRCRKGPFRGPGQISVVYTGRQCPYVAGHLR
jgi:hypothetical protein